HARARDLDDRRPTAGEPETEERRHDDGDRRGAEDPSRPPARRPRRAAREPQRREVPAELPGGLGPPARWRASTTRRCRARPAGARPRSTPIAVANASPRRKPPGERCRRTVATVNVIMLNCTPESNVSIASTASAASTTPATSPPAARSNDSVRNETRIAARPKPSARSVPISAVRLATAAYIVLSAPKTAPTGMTTASVRTRTYSEFALSACSS